MPVNHRINVVLKKEQDKESRIQGNGSKVSAASTLKKSRQSGSNRNLKNLSKITTSNNTQGALAGSFKGTAGGIYTTILLGNKGHNMFLDYKASISGNTMTAGNIKKAKSYILGFGIPYLRDHLRNELFTKNVIHRENISREYYQKLYFEKYEGNQYDGRVR